ncbi:hypothetical protein [Lactococcus lactis]|uniref:hypothetical protein n=1 Tax=Lactococcus lactis TaxID=1358 RepID=UPI00288F9F4E|nr:hypothetical protein [Lactococcus lactis]MDT2904828.1 hypothetical protein [Lactococcus lactis]MDT2911336.1 hypothetical protein [Lactococcus lactis]MDT2933011.1 hypothetical protein [Lactococcus lactis]MDT2937873.1 hypothetical protein [Lactococcus lactis]
MKKSVFEIIPDYYYLKKDFKDSVAIIKDPNVASIFDLDKPVDIDYSEFLKKDFPKGQLIPLELAVKKYLEGKKPKTSVIYKEAVDYINSLDSPLETLCYTNKRTRTEKMVWIILFVVQLIYTFIFFLISLSWITSLIAFASFPLVLFIIFIMLLNDEPLHYGGGDRMIKVLFPEKHRKTKDFELFISILEKYSFSNIPDIALFIFLDESSRFYPSRYKYEFNVTYDLFNRVKTFALESFLAADQNNDEEALQKILLPMTQDILKEAQDKYEQHLKLENDFEDIQKKQLDENIKTDINIYKKRMFH